MLVNITARLCYPYMKFYPLPHNPHGEFMDNLTFIHLSYINNRRNFICCKTLNMLVFIYYFISEIFT